jgi:hypothetical protein
MAIAAGSKLSRGYYSGEIWDIQDFNLSISYRATAQHLGRKANSQLVVHVLASWECRLNHAAAFQPHSSWKQLTFFLVSS